MIEELKRAIEIIEKEKARIKGLVSPVMVLGMTQAVRELKNEIKELQEADDAKH